MLHIESVKVSPKGGDKIKVNEIACLTSRRVTTCQCLLVLTLNPKGFLIQHK